MLASVCNLNGFLKSTYTKTGVLVHSSKFVKSILTLRFHLTELCFLAAFLPEINLYRGLDTCAYFLMNLQ